MFWSYIAFWLLNRAGLLRVALEAEAIGMDASHMGSMHSYAAGMGIKGITGAKVRSPLINKMLIMHAMTLNNTNDGEEHTHVPSIAPYLYKKQYNGAITSTCDAVENIYVIMCHACSPCMHRQLACISVNLYRPMSVYVDRLLKNLFSCWWTVCRCFDEWGRIQADLRLDPAQENQPRYWSKTVCIPTPNWPYIQRCHPERHHTGLQFGFHYSGTQAQFKHQWRDSPSSSPLAYPRVVWDWVLPQVLVVPVQVAHLVLSDSIIIDYGSSYAPCAGCYSWLRMTLNKFR